MLKAIDAILDRLTSNTSFNERTIDGEIHKVLLGAGYLQARTPTKATRGGGDRKECLEIPHYTTSTDALFTLIVHALPHWRIETLCEWDHALLRKRGPWTADLMRRDEDFSHMFPAKCPHAPTAARALLVAVLQAIRIEIGTNIPKTTIRH